MLGTLPKLVITAPSLMKVAKVLEGSPRRFSDFRPAWQQLLPFLAEGLEQNLKSGGDSLGARFPELATSTAAFRQRIGLGTQILIRRGDLLSNVANPSSAKRQLTRSMLRVGPSAELGRYPFVLHYGSPSAGKGGRSRIPARPYIHLSESMRTVSLNVVNAHAIRMLGELAEELRALE